MPVWAFSTDNNVFTFKDNLYFTPNVFIGGVLIVIRTAEIATLWYFEITYENQRLLITVRRTRYN